MVGWTLVSAWLGEHWYLHVEHWQLHGWTLTATWVNTNSYTGERWQLHGWTLIATHMNMDSNPPSPLKKSKKRCYRASYLIRTWGIRPRYPTLDVNFHFVRGKVLVVHVGRVRSIAVWLHPAWPRGRLKVKVAAAQLLLQYGSDHAWGVDHNLQGQPVKNQPLFLLTQWRFSFLNWLYVIFTCAAPKRSKMHTGKDLFNSQTNLKNFQKHYTWEYLWEMRAEHIWAFLSAQMLTFKLKWTEPNEPSEREVTVPFWQHRLPLRVWCNTNESLSVTDCRRSVPVQGWGYQVHQ